MKSTVKELQSQDDRTDGAEDADKDLLISDYEVDLLGRDFASQCRITGITALQPARAA